MTTTDKGMSFGEMLLHLRNGEKCRRAGWNGKGMHIYLTEGHKVKAEDWTGDPSYIVDGSVEILPHIDMWTVNSRGRRAILCGWLASQTDMIEEDWEVVE